MNIVRKSCSCIFVLAVTIAVLGVVSFGQGAEVRKGAGNYEATLYVLIGSEKAEGNERLPDRLSAVSRRIRENFSFEHCRLAGTYFGRLGMDGSLEHKSVSTIPGLDVEGPAFVEWQLIRSKALEAPNSGMRIDKFWFGAKLPVRTARRVEGQENGSAQFSYESIGLSINMLNVTENTPTLLGTITLPGTSGTAFLVMEVRAA